MVVGILLLMVAGHGVPGSLTGAAIAGSALALLHVAAPALVWSVAGGLTAGATVLLVESAASILTVFARQSLALGSDAGSPLVAVALAVAPSLMAALLGTYAGGVVMAYRSVGRATLGRGFVAGALAEVARLLSWLFPSVHEWPSPAAIVSLLSLALPVLLAAPPVVGLVGAAGVWLGSSTRVGRRPAIVGWSGSLLVLLALVWVTSNVLGPVLSGRTGLAPGVTRDAIRAVGVGMTRDEVEKILGPPVSSGPTPYREGGVALTYARPVPFARWYPMLWVHLREGRVVEVYGKRYIAWGMDDVGVYGLRAERRWEGTEFEATFQR